MSVVGRKQQKNIGHQPCIFTQTMGSGTDDIAEKRDSLVDQLTRRMEQKTERETFFTIRWEVK